MSSLLFQEIREKRGLVYSIFSYPLYFKNCGLFMIYAGTSLKNARNVVEIILEEIRKLRQNIPDKMLATAREQLKGSLVLGLESTGSKMSFNGKNLFYYEKYIKETEIMKIINEIDKDELEKLVEYVFNPSYYALTAVGPFKENVFEWLIHPESVPV